MPTRDASQGVASQAQQQSVTVDVTFTDGSVRVTVGPDRLLQALDNLLSTAVKFITEGGLVRFERTLEDVRMEDRSRWRAIGVAVPPSRFVGRSS